MRAFLALPLGAEPGARVGELVQRTLAVTGEAEHLRFTRAAGLHVTLAFLGEVAGAGIESLALALPGAVAGLPAPVLELTGGGAFPDACAARVLWVGVREREEPGRLAALHAAVLSAVRSAGLALPHEEREPFRPHVTVARARGRGRALPTAFAAARLLVPWTPEGVVLFESVSGPGGARHEPRASVPFSSPRA